MIAIFKYIKGDFKVESYILFPFPLRVGQQVLDLNYSKAAFKLDIRTTFRTAK